MARTKSDSRRTTTNRAKRSPLSNYGRVISDRPATVAAIASGVAAAVVGFLAFKRSGKTLSELSDEAGTWIKDGIADVKAKAKGSEPLKDGIGETRTQSEIAEEALTVKQTGKKAKHPVDPTIEEELKTGAISY